MTDSIEFLCIVASFAAVLSWYLKNELAGSDGLVGLLALADDPDAAKPNARRRSYRIKQRIARRAHERRDATSVRAAAMEAKRAFRTIDEGERMRRRFRRQDEARYRVKDKAAADRNGTSTGAA